MHVEYADDTGGCESTIYLEPIEDTDMGPQAHGNGYELLRIEADHQKIGCQRTAWAHGAVLQQSPPEILDLLQPEAAELQRWRCRLIVEWLLMDTTIPGTIPLQARCSADCYLRAHTLKEPTTEVIKKLAIAAARPYLDRY